MDERTRIWQEVGLRFILDLPHPGQDTPTVETTPAPRHACDVAPPAKDNTGDTPRYPEPLVFYRQRLSPPIKALVTYAQLDDDMRGRPNPDRRVLIQAIIDKAMPWKTREVAFWPAILQSSAQVSNDELLTALIHVCHEFGPTYILDFGGCLNEPDTSFFEDHLAASLRSHSPAYVVLPSLDDMLPDNKPVKKSAWDILRRLTP